MALVEPRRTGCRLLRQMAPMLSPVYDTRSASNVRDGIEVGGMTGEGRVQELLNWSSHRKRV